MNGRPKNLCLEEAEHGRRQLLLVLGLPDLNLGGIKALFSGPVAFNISALQWYDMLSWQPPTPTVISFSGSEFAAKPLVVVADACGMAGIQWDPGTEILTQIWSENNGDAAPNDESPRLTRW